MLHHLLGEKLLDANWQVPNSNSGGVIDGIGNRGRRADIGEFAETIYTGRIYVVIDFGHENSLDLPDIGVHGDHVVREIVVDVASMLVVNLVAPCSAELSPQMRPPIS